MPSERIIIKGDKGSIFFEKDAGDDGTYEVSKELKLSSDNSSLEFDGGAVGSDKGLKGQKGIKGQKGQKGLKGQKGQKGLKGQKG